jgi:hypothetical protein
MILTTIIIVLVLAIAFFHYTQGFFSATISAMLAILSAVLAFSLHEKVVEGFLGGRFSDAAHGIALGVLFALIYFILRVAFDSMVPGNVRFPVLVDKIGGGAMGLIAGLFAGGIVAIMAQYMPLMPSVAGYSRYAVDTHTVTVPSEATGGRALDSETWDKVKSEKPGQFDPGDRQSMVLPMDDLVVNTVSRLSDGGSLGWDQPLAKSHPDFLQELFANRLGVQTKAPRVATKDAISSVELYRVDLLARKDHEYKELRERPLETTPLKPTPNQVLVVARIVFTKNAADKDGLVKFSPGSVRLVSRRGSGAGAEWVDYYPIGTVDNGQVLYASSIDDFLFVDSKSADRGADFAFLVDKNGFAEGGQGGPLVVAPDTFIEFKRMARHDLSGTQLKAPDKYKASDKILVLRKKQAKAPEGAAPEATASPADALKAKLVGNWMGSSDAGTLAIDFKADGSLTFNNTPKTGVPQVGQGTWVVVPEKTTADTLVITRTVNGTPAENSIKFTDDNNLTLTSAGRPPLQLQKRS